MSQGTKRELTFHYKGFFDDGTVFTDSTAGEPYTITTGFKQQLFPALADVLAEMEVGEERTVPVGHAYGELDPEAVQTRIMRFAIPDGDKLKEGDEVMWRGPKNPNDPIPARIIRADEYSFDIDFNHPLAGKDLTYWVKLIDAKEV